MSKVTKLYPKDAAKNPDFVLEKASGIYSKVLVIGYDKAGEMDVRGSTNLKEEEMIHLMAAFKHNLLNGDYDDEVDS